MFILLGIFIGYLANTQETSNVIALLLLTALVFFSSTILPIEAMPAFIGKLIVYNPFVIAETAMRKSIIFGFSFIQLKLELIKLLGYNLLFFILGLIGMKIKSVN